MVAVLGQRLDNEASSQGFDLGRVSESGGRNTPIMTQTGTVHNGSLTFVGFGFGAIQAGLFVLEAQRSGNFDRIVLAEVLPEIVSSIRHQGGQYRLNIAHRDRIESLTVGPIQIETTTGSAWSTT